MDRSVAESAGLSVSGSAVAIASPFNVDGSPLEVGVGNHLRGWPWLVSLRLLPVLYALTGRSGVADDFRSAGLRPAEREVAEVVLDATLADASTTPSMIRPAVRTSAARVRTGVEPSISTATSTCRRPDGCPMRKRLPAGGGATSFTVGPGSRAATAVQIAPVPARAR